MSTHLAKFVELAGSNFNAFKSNPPFFTSASWHSTQCWSRNRRAGGPSAAGSGAATASSRLNGRIGFMRWTAGLVIIEPARTRPVNACPDELKLLSQRDFARLRRMKNAPVVLISGSTDDRGAEFTDYSLSLSMNYPLALMAA